MTTTANLDESTAVIGNAIQPSDCTVFVQIYVDTNAASQGSTSGIYLVDNQTTAGSKGEGTPTLTTAATMNSNICFTLLNVDPQDTSLLSIENVGNSNAFGFNGTPRKYSSNIWTGTLANASLTNAPYSLNLSITKQHGGGSLTTTVNPSISVS